MLSGVEVVLSSSSRSRCLLHHVAESGQTLPAAMRTIIILAIFKIMKFSGLSLLEKWSTNQYKGEF